uniref:TIL domain-containing protein n=1 Tax=Anopheles minimus TaxID=112268 RepID=A0A182WBB8_9DIPT
RKQEQATYPTRSIKAHRQYCESFIRKVLRNNFPRKMLRNFVVLVLVLSTLMCAWAQITSAPAATTTPVCKKGEVYQKCGSPCSSESRCGTRKPMCKPMCSPGCYCVKGYARNANNVCVPQNMCFYKNFNAHPFAAIPGRFCIGGGQFNVCGNSCKEPKCNTIVRSYCPAACEIGCFCPPGYARNANAVLSVQLLFLDAQTPEAESKRPLCPPNETFALCGNKCREPKCDKPLTTSCPKICQSGCYCIAGYARNGKAQSPEPMAQTPVCRPNETYYTCGNDCKEPKCYKSINKICPKICVPSCYCISGYARNQQGSCVPYKMLALLNAQTAAPAIKRPLCKQNEVFNTCGTRCMERKCNENTALRAAFCMAKCQPGCFCLAGYARNKDDLCVPYKIGRKCMIPTIMNTVCTKFVDCDVVM